MMKRVSRLLSIAGAAGLLALSASSRPSVTASAAAQPGPRCSVHTLHGTYAAEQSGWVGTGAARVPYSEAGFVRLDGQGNINGATMFSVDGVIGSHPVTGTYTVDPETCTGDAVTNIGTFHFAIGDNGKQTRFVSTTPTTTLNGELIEQ
jgi:hypothetical protein